MTSRTFRDAQGKTQLFVLFYLLEVEPNCSGFNSWMLLQRGKVVINSLQSERTAENSGQFSKEARLQILKVDLFLSQHKQRAMAQ